MANKQYLDKGGLEHAWSKIKSWIQTYLSSWKTTNFGIGTYSNYGELDIQTNNSYLRLYASSHIILHPDALIEIGSGMGISLQSANEHAINNTNGYGMDLVSPDSCQIMIARFVNTGYIKAAEKIGFAVIRKPIRSSTSSSDKNTVYNVSGINLKLSIFSITTNGEIVGTVGSVNNNNYFKIDKESEAHIIVWYPA